MKKELNKFDSWQKKITEIANTNDTEHELRAGQIYMLALYDIDFQAYQEITGNSLDCFYDDSLCGDLVRYLLNHWKNKKE